MRFWKSEEFEKKIIFNRNSLDFIKKLLISSKFYFETLLYFKTFQASKKLLIHLKTFSLS